MQGILYEEPSVWLFILVTVLMGGAAAWRTGRVMAKSWKPPGLLAFYMVMLGAAVRFIHFALFEGTLFSLHFYLVDTAILGVVAALGFRFQRTESMTRQYRFAYRQTSPFSWARRDPDAPQ